MRIYLASSWRNQRQPEVLAALRSAGHEVYDFRNPAPGDTGFHWSDIEPDWKDCDANRFRAALDHPIADAGFAKDWAAMHWAQVGVLLLPTGRSAHLESGYFVGAGKPLFVLMLGENEPELMYKMATDVCTSVAELLDELGRVVPSTNSPDAEIARLTAELEARKKQIGELATELFHKNERIFDSESRLLAADHDHLKARCATRDEIHALKQTLDFLKDEEGKSHQGYFWNGWAGARLRELFERAQRALSAEQT